MTNFLRLLAPFLALVSLVTACRPGTTGATGYNLEGKGYVLVPISNDLYRPGAVIVANLSQGGQPLSPEVVCNTVESIGLAAADKSDDVSDGPAGDWSETAETNFKAAAEAKVYKIVKAQAGAQLSYKIEASLVNTRLLQHTTATLLDRVHNKKRENKCTCAIELDDKTKKSIIQAVIVADVLVSITKTDGAGAEASVDLQQVTASLGGNFSVSGTSGIKGSQLTIAYRLNQNDELIRPEGTSCQH